MPMMPIPPRGVTATTFTVERVRHGWDVTVQVRELDQRAQTEDGALMDAALFLFMDGVQRRPDVAAWLRHVFHELLDMPE